MAWGLQGKDQNDERRKQMRFPSATRKEYCYETSKEWNYSSTRGNYIDEHYYEYWSGNDGMTKHAPEYNVQTDNWIDFFASLYMHLEENPDDLKEIAYNWPLPVYKDKVKFFLELKYDEKKRKYYNESELKVSCAPAKANDRRWELVPEWADCSVEACMRFLMPRSNSLYRFALYLQIREVFYELYKWYDSVNGYGIGLDDESCHNAQDCFSAVAHLVASYREKDNARRVFECLKHNWIDRKLAA
jgi:hypothetical protein